jgi:CheY-like chemotaxis protein
VKSCKGLKGRKLMEWDAKVLYLNEYPDTANVLADMLAGWDHPPYLKLATSLEELQSFLNSGQWDLLICEYNFSEININDVLKIVNDNFLDIPIITLADDLTEENVLELIKAGIDDCMPKKDLFRL